MMRNRVECFSTRKNVGVMGAKKVKTENTKYKYCAHGIKNFHRAIRMKTRLQKVGRFCIFSPGLTNTSPECIFANGELANASIDRNSLLA
mmetsp:Transcript_11658/g.27326  ORF Transcript_11658/g.27326 Transcript_11658/m.27326 type:complete len:90 (-) Transcript_11658:132-401(-)